jgi:hypothetical protein
MFWLANQFKASSRVDISYQVRITAAKFTYVNLAAVMIKQQMIRYLILSRSIVVFSSFIGVKNQLDDLQIIQLMMNTNENPQIQ